MESSDGHGAPQVHGKESEPEIVLDPESEDVDGMSEGETLVIQPAMSQSWSGGRLLSGLPTSANVMPGGKRWWEQHRRSDAKQRIELCRQGNRRGRV